MPNVIAPQPLAERNRIGREIHDVLAHSLGALSVQLEAADALLESGPRPRRGTPAATAGASIRRRGPVRDARSRARPAGRAGGSDRTADRLWQQPTAPISPSPGAARPLPSGVALALYRAAQEALSNARKHAPGASVSLCLTFNAVNDRAAG